MNKHIASTGTTVTSSAANHLKNNNTYYHSSLLSSLKSNDASSSYNSSITNINNKSSSSNYSPSLTTTNTANTAGTTNSASLYNDNESSKMNINNNNNNNNTTMSSNYSPLKQSINKPFRSFIGTTSNGGGNVSVISNVTDKKIGHREVKDGVVHYKKVPTDELKKSIQFGVVHSISVSNKFQDRDILMHDFQTVETIVFPKAGSASTPAHNFNDFKLKVYAPYGFKYLRKKFNLDEADFMHSISQTDLKEISNPGASGSVFYKTSDDKYILKTVQYQECEFLKTLLAGIFFNLFQNLIDHKYSLLPTIYGLYCYQKLELTSMLSDKTNIRVVIMNNILPSDIVMHEKYDLKGSFFKRKASKQERAKSTPTFKDLDFLDEHPEGISLDEKYYDNIVGSLKRDCQVLKSFGIMDYSLLLGIHNLEKEKNNKLIDAYFDLKLTEHPPTTTAEQPTTASAAAALGLSVNDQKTNKLNKVFNMSAVPARSAKGDRLLLYIGIIDILQSYRFKKKLEHTLKSMITDGSQISVCHPDYYENRFIDFVSNRVFKKQKEGEFKKYGRRIMAALALKTSPARRRTIREQSQHNKNKDVSSALDQSNLNNSLQINDSVISSSSSPPTDHQLNNYKNLKPIDSVDSISEIKSPISTNPKTFSKFDNINEDVSDRKSQNDYQDTNAIATKKSQVISIVEHYEQSTSNLKTKTNDNINIPYDNIVNQPKFNVQYHKLIRLKPINEGELGQKKPAINLNEANTSSRNKIDN